MACQILRNQNNEIERVLAENGQDSALFNNLNQLVNGDKEQALRLWAKTYTPSFKAWFEGSNSVDSNREPLILYKGVSSDQVKESTEYNLFDSTDLSEARKIDETINRFIPVYSQIGGSLEDRQNGQKVNDNLLKSVFTEGAYTFVEPNTYYSKSTANGIMSKEVAESNRIFKSQIEKLATSTNGSISQGKAMSKTTLLGILENIKSKGERVDYDHILIELVNGKINLTNSKSYESNERAKRAFQLMSDISQRTGLNYQVDYYLPYPGMFKDGIVVINPYHSLFGTDVVWHEALGHPVVEAVFQQGENSTLLNSLKDQINENVGGIKEFMAENYPEYQEGTDEYYKEAITTLLGRYLDFHNKSLTSLQVKQNISLESAIIKFLERFLSRAKNFLNGIIEGYNRSNKKISVEDLKSKSLTIQELATILGSTQNYFDLSKVKFNSEFYSKTTTASPLEQSILDAQSQGVTQTLENQLTEAFKQASKQFRVLKNKVSPEQRKTLLRLVNYLEDPATFGQVRTLATFVTETDALLDFYLKDGIRIAKEYGQNADKVSALHFVLQVAQSYDPIISSMERDYLMADNDNAMKLLLRNSKSKINDIKALYSREVEQPIANVLAETADPAVQSVLADYNRQIEYLQSRLTTANEGTARYNSLESAIAKLQAEKERLVPDKNSILATLRGQRGDVSVLSMYLEAPIAGGDMVVSTFAKYIKDMLNQVRQRLLPIKDQAQENLDSFKRATGRSNKNNREFYEGLYEKVQRGTVNPETGDLEIQEFYALVGQFNQEYIIEQQKFLNEISKLKKAGNRVEWRQKFREYEQWQNKYMEREYTEQYYAAENLLTDEAREAQAEVRDKMDILKDSIRADGGTIENSEELDELYKSYIDLGRLYDRLGNKKTGKDLAIAESIRAFRVARREMETFELTEQGQANFNSLKQRQLDKVKAGYITEEEYQQWINKNTTRRIHPEFYEQRNRITKRISDILSKLPPEVLGKESTENLWEQIFAIAGNHRDNDRIVDGSDMNSDELSRVKDNETELEEIRQRTLSLSGLTPEESFELSGLFNEEQNQEVSDRIRELLNKKRTKKAEILQYITDAELNLLYQSYEELGELQVSEPTSYYYERYQSEFDAWRANQTFDEGVSLTYMRHEFENSEWFKQNHTYKTVPIINENKEFEGWRDEPIPLYVWRDVRPKDKALIDENYPSSKYFDRIVKDQFINQNYRNSVDGYNTPKLTVDENGQRVANKYINQSYETLKNDQSEAGKSKFQMLQFLTNTYEEGQRKLPMEKRMGLLLPAIEKDAIDRLQDTNGIKSFGKQQWERVKRNWTLTEQDSDTALGDVAGIEFNYIPVKYTGNISTDNVNLNLLESVMKHRYMAEEYQVLEGTQSMAYALQYTVDAEQNKISTGKIDRFLKKLGFNVEVLKSGQSNRSKQLQEFIKTVWYGELQKDATVFGLSTSKIVNNLMGVSAMQILALNIPAHVTNAISGEVQSFIEANANKYFGREDWAKSKRLYAQNAVNFWNDYRKEGKKSLLSQMAELYDVPQGSFEDEFGKKTDYSNLREGKGWLFFLKNAGEHEIQVSTFIAMASRKMVKKGDSMIPLIDAYELDDHGNIKLKEGVEFGTIEQNFFNGQVHGLLKDLNGNYNKFDRPLVEKYSIGRLMFFMRKFLVPMAARRFEGRRLDMEMGAVQEGYYVTFARTLLVDLVKYKGDLISRWGDMTDEEKQAARRTITELGIILTLALLISLLGGYDKDRKMDQEGITSVQFWKLHLIYQMMKVKSETENFIPLPGLGFDEAIRTTKTTSIAWRSLEQITAVAQEFGNLAVNSDSAYFNRDYGIWEKGDLKLLSRMGRLVGFSGNIMHPELLIKNFELGQKVK